MRVCLHTKDYLMLAERPWPFWLLGLVLLVIAVGSGTLIAREILAQRAAEMVDLECSRGDGTCRLTSGAGALRRSEQFPLAELEGATVGTGTGDAGQGCLVLVRRGRLPQAIVRFAPDGAEAAARLNRFLKDASLPSFHYRYDPGWASLGNAALVDLLIAALGAALLLMPCTRWDFDAGRGTATRTRSWCFLLRRTKPWPLASLAGAELVCHDSGESGPVYSIELVARDGRRISLDDWAVRRAAVNRQVVEAVSAMLVRR